jgi:DNA-binding transcriptional LysR family regulator
VYLRIPRATIDMLAAVVAVAETKTLDKAAAVLGLSTASAVHKRIKAASALFEADLFFSTHDGLALTEEGQTLYDGALRAVGQTLLAEEKVSALVKLKAGRLLIGHCTYLPPKLLAAVVKLDFGSGQAMPIQIEHIPGFTEMVVQQVTEGTLHEGFGYLPVQDRELLSRVLFEELLVIAMPVRHLLAVKPFLRPQDLTGEPFIAVFRHTLP